MNKLKLSLENCYGIRALDHEFDFSKDNVFAVYAPNGSMKSSLAQTFKDLSQATASKDRIFPSRACVRKITDENGVELPGAHVLVVPPYDEVLGHTERTSTLLVNAQLRKEYEELHEAIDKAKKDFLDAMKAQSGSKKDLEREISTTFAKSDEAFYRALFRIEEELLSQQDAPFADVRYDVIFDEKVLGFLDQKDFKTAVEAYVKKYNELLAASKFFRKGTFNYYNAGQIAKSLSENGFFSAKHSVSLNADEKVEITSEKQLEALIAKEKEGISSDQELRKKFAEIEKLITKNASVRDFEAYLGENEAILPKLANVDAFKEEIWKSYFKARIELYKEVVAKYRAVENRKREIEEEAQKERTQWEAVIEIFNARFFVPFKLVAKNKAAVILGGDSVLSLAFTFEDGAESAPVERSTLIQALSMGEKKALYILNLIFEIEVRRRDAQDTLFIVDDIADSFDYKNKYAIIQYLKDIAEESCFKLLILTHNFDFFRTLNSRFVKYSHCLLASKSGSGVSLHKADGIKNIFVNDWKGKFYTDPRKRIASIPFIRNIIEYTKGEADTDFLRLTSLVHWKSDSMSITQRDLNSIFLAVFWSVGMPITATTDGAKPVIDSIFAEAQGCLQANDGINFENKVVLSIATRLAAEKFMVIKIGDANFVNSITANQTTALVAKYKAMFPGETEAINTLVRVVLMTPENIHLNSFMYEPILDMSDEHLRKLYQDVQKLA